MLNNKVGDWIKEWLMFSWKITFLRSFLSGFTGKYCLSPDILLKVIISLYVKRNLYSFSIFGKKGGGKFKKKIVYNLNNLCLSFSRDCHQGNRFTIPPVLRLETSASCVFSLFLPVL